MEARDSLIVALDFPSGARAFEFLELLSDRVPTADKLTWVKVGLELFLAEGPATISKLSEQGFQVFLDLKLHDIPNTVAGAIRSLLPYQPALLTVHASGGPAMLSAATAAAEGSATRLLAVTVLTSMKTEELAATGIPSEVADQVTRLAQLAQSCGINGLVCSPKEAGMLRGLLPGAHLVTPGIRPAGSDLGDQHRVATAAEAIRSGATQLVVGRPITAAPDPVLAYLNLLREVEHALTAERPSF